MGDLRLAPAWSLLVGQVGRGAIIAALVAFLASVILCKSIWSRRTFVLGALCLWTAFICLGILFAQDQFQFEYVRGHGDATTDLKYKIAGIWSGQQGSFLLWACTAAIWGVFAARATGIYRQVFTAVYSLFLAGLAAILAFETPFAVNLVEGKAMIPTTGSGLTPSLQNIWNVIHPPTIFTGFGSLTVPFAWALAAMIKRNSTDWVASLRPWAIASSTILGLGLCMGGFWAYETLGWGGFWAWDPVENTSFVPWIFSVCLVHGLLIQAATKKWSKANLLLAGIPFWMFLYGTYLTRSGVYTDVSVHSFAQMDRTALKLLMAMGGAAIVGFAGVWGWFCVKAPKPSIAKNAPGPSREKLYRFAIMTLAGIGLATAIGMSVPLLMLLSGKNPKVVEEQHYHFVLVYFLFPMMVLMAITPLASWKSESWKELLSKSATDASIAFALTGLSVMCLHSSSFGAGVGFDEPIALPKNGHMSALALIGFMLFFVYYAACANGLKMLELAKRSKLGLGGFVAHFGVACILAGLLISRGMERKEQFQVQRSTPGQALGYKVAFKGFNLEDQPFNRENKALFSVTKAGDTFTAQPGLFFLQDQSQSFVWPHIQRYATHDIYFSLHSPVINVWDKPVVVPPNQTLTQDSVTVTNLGLSTEGPLGQVGAKFKVHLRFTYADNDASGNKVMRTFDASPELKIGENGLEPSFAAVGPDLMCSLEGIDAGTKSATVSLLFREAVFPIELFYKPMTGLIYLGAGILTLGGIMAAFYRRVKPKSQPDEAAEPQIESSTRNESDALVPTA